MFGYMMAERTIDEFANGFITFAIFFLDIDDSIIALTSKPDALDWY